LLVAPKTARVGDSGAQGTDEDDEEEGVDRGIYEDGVGDSRGWYEDGAYTAAPTSLPSPRSAGSDDEHGTSRDAQNVYYKALIGRFEALRWQLAQVPPRHAVERLDEDHGCYMSASEKDYRKWKWRLGHTEPKPAQLAGMGKETVLRLLRIVGDRKARIIGTDSLVGEGGGGARRKVSAWVWGLLARLPERGELASEEVGVVRELGKRAVWVGVEIKGVDMGGLEEQMGDGEGGGNENEEVVDVEIDEELDPQADDESFLNEHEMRIRIQHRDASSPEPHTASYYPDRPVTGPISPASLRGQSSQHINSNTKDDISETPTRETLKDNDEILTEARTRLIAGIQHDPDHQPAITTSIIQELLEETEKVLSLPYTTAQEIKDCVTAMRKQLKKIVSATKEHNRHPLWPKLEEKAGDMTLLIDSAEHELRVTDGFEDSTVDAHVASDSEEGEWSGDSDGDGDAKQAEEEDGEVVEHEQEKGVGQKTGEEQKEDKASAIQATKVLLDMIITIAGEVYGQRDLLEFREVWE